MRRGGRDIQSVETLGELEKKKKKGVEKVQEPVMTANHLNGKRGGQRGGGGLLPEKTDYGEFLAKEHVSHRTQAEGN